MQRTFCDIAENQRGELRVGIAYTRGRAILPGILEAFAGVYPNVRVILTEERNHTLQNLLHEGRADLAIARFQKPLPGIEVQPFYTEDTVLLVSRQLLQTCGIDLAAHRTEIERGQVLAKPGSIHPHTHFMGQVYVLTKEEGGRHTPFFKGYRPQFYFRTTDVTGTIELPEGVEMVMPGDNISMTVQLICPIAMQEGLRFAIREGGHTVGAGVVAKIIE
mgnify:CR=1 FL=1